jgi:hypothetical protein
VELQQEGFRTGRKQEWKEAVEGGSRTSKDEDKKQEKRK